MATIIQPAPAPTSHDLPNYMLIGYDRTTTRAYYRYNLPRIPTAQLPL